MTDVVFKRDTDARHHIELYRAYDSFGLGFNVWKTGTRYQRFRRCYEGRLHLLWWDVMFWIRW